MHPTTEIDATIKRERGAKIMECSFCYRQNNAYIWPMGKLVSMLGRATYFTWPSLRKRKRYTTIVMGNKV